MRHQDFTRIRNEFITYYKDTAKGESEYYTWLNALHLDERLCYSQTHEKFMWAKDMLKSVGEDAENKYYKVLVAFPLESMNGNVYREADLQADAQTVTKGHPSLNHRDEYRLSPDSRYGAVYITGAQYEDGAVEALLKVPKTTLCPTTGECLFKVIDAKRIVNVSLEGFTAENGRFHFNEKIPFTLLMSNVLPGIPLARIFPIEQRLEAYMPNLRSSSHRRIKIVGLEHKMKEETPPNADLCPKCGKPMADCTCSKEPKEELGKDLQAVNDEITKLEVDLAAMDNYNQKDILRAKLNDLYSRKNALLALSSPKAESTEPYATSTVNPITATVTNAGVSATGPAIPDDNDAKHIQGESVPALKVKALKAEQKAKLAEKKLSEATDSYDLSRAELEAKLTEAYSLNNTQAGKITVLEAQITRLEAQQTVFNAEKIHDGTEVKSLQRRLEDMTQSRDQYIKQYGDLKTEHEKITAKYRETLSSNLELERKLTETNEEYLGIAKKAETLEDKIKHVNRITKVSAKF